MSSSCFHELKPNAKICCLCGQRLTRSERAEVRSKAASAAHMRDNALTVGSSVPIVVHAASRIPQLSALLAKMAGVSPEEGIKPAEPGVIAPRACNYRADGWPLCPVCDCDALGEAAVVRDANASPDSLRQDPLTFLLCANCAWCGYTEPCIIPESKRDAWVGERLASGTLEFLNDERIRKIMGFLGWRLHVGLRLLILVESNQKYREDILRFMDSLTTLVKVP